MRILIDADACPVPVKKIIYKTSKRLNIEVILVANQFMRTPESQLIQSIVVSSGPDEADNKIVDIASEDDLVITQDIPLADRIIKKKSHIMDPRGNILTSDNIGNRLAMRDLMDELRSGNMITGGGPPPFSDKDKQNFANALDRFLVQNFKA